jgi:hypothetical protein
MFHKFARALAWFLNSHGKFSSVDRTPWYGASSENSPANHTYAIIAAIHGISGLDGLQPL